MDGEEAHGGRGACRSVGGIYRLNRTVSTCPCHLLECVCVCVCVCRLHFTHTHVLSPRCLGRRLVTMDMNVVSALITPPRLPSPLPLMKRDTPPPSPLAARHSLRL